MNDRYMRELRRQMRCSRKTQNRLLEQFTAYQMNSLDETPDYDRMVTMFGPPDEMAWTLMAEITQNEHSAYRRNRLILKAVAFVMAVSFVFFSLYIMFVKENTMIEVERKTYYGTPYESPDESEVLE